jgi:hypothetical protein
LKKRKNKMNKLIILFRLILIISLAGIGCGGGGTNGTGIIDIKVRVQGEIKDSEGNAVSDAKVKVIGDEQEYITDINGKFDFESKNAIGNFVLEVKKGEAESRLEVNSGPSVQNTVGITLTLNTSGEFEINRINRDQDIASARTCTKDIECGMTEYCNFIDLNCGSNGTKGSCEQLPSVCTTQFDPVCGCDGKKYGNSCNAATSAISVSSSRNCLNAEEIPQETLINECQTNADCSEGFYCFTENIRGDIVSRCSALDSSIGGCPTVFNPVCGANGVTYGNDCEANAAGQTIIKPGACLDTPMGGCSTIFSPVCGANGITYGTTCEAN